MRKRGGLYHLYQTSKRKCEGPEFRLQKLCVFWQVCYFLVALPWLPLCNVFVHACVCTCECVYACTRPCLYWVGVCVCWFVFVCGSVCVHEIREYVCACVSASMCVILCVCVYVCVCVCVYPSEVHAAHMSPCALPLSVPGIMCVCVCVCTCVCVCVCVFVDFFCVCAYLF